MTSRSECVVCGFAVGPILERAHLDQNRSNTVPDNLAWLCPTCHRMHDTGLIPTALVKAARDNGGREDVGLLHKRIAEAVRSGEAVVSWKLLQKDAQQRGGQKLQERALARARSEAAKRAWQTRRQQAESK